MKRSVHLLLCLCLLALPLTACTPKRAESNAPSAPSPVAAIPILPSATTSPEISAPLGIDTQLSQEEIESIKNAWAFDAEWAMTTPWPEGNGDPWHVGLGNAYEATLGLPYDGIDITSEPAQDLVALSFGTVEYHYYDGFSLMLFSDFYGDKTDEPSYSVAAYISTTQPDCETPRGIHPGSTLAETNKAYPELQKQEGYWTENNPDSGNASHDSCYVYAPEGTNRSILFLIKDDIVVQIDMADGLDGQLWSPSGPGVYHAK
ncbi:MAG: hypothetical protein EOM52_05830 [Clostridia bacterium]|nr:hypothetical protein [Clostridia bacterium]